MWTSFEELSRGIWRISPGTVFHVKGVFLWNDNNGDTIPQPQELLITVKAGTTDSIVLA